MELDVASGREKTNLEMDVYRQALGAVEEQLLPTGEFTHNIAGHARFTHTHTNTQKLRTHLRGVRQLSGAQTCANLSSR